MKGFIALGVGIVFALGLGLSGMTQPHVVKGFLDVFGQWDARLLGVMSGAIVVHAIALRFILKRPTPVFNTYFDLTSKHSIDSDLVLGAILFGLGWGWAGICPGPGIVALASGELSFVYFVVAMLVGMKLFQLTKLKR